MAISPRFAIRRFLIGRALESQGMDSSANDDSLALSHRPEEENRMFGIALHGGAGTLPRSEMNAEQEKCYRSGLERALSAGYSVLEGGGASLDAVTRAIVVLED